MKRWVGLALVLEIAPLIAFGLLAMLHPVGDPQKSGRLFVRFLDFQGTWWIRHGIPMPPPLLFAGNCLSIVVWLRYRSRPAAAAAVLGMTLMAFWALTMLAPILIYVE